MKTQTSQSTISNITPTISIIVPVYQVRPYLRVCLDSIIAQSFTDWEMLLIDDGSTDGGEKICDEYGERDARIHVFHQENQGLSAARNLGLDNARGMYYTMVDSDDILVTPDYLGILYNALVDNNADMSACGHIFFFDGNIVPNPIDIDLHVKLCTGREFYFLRGFPSWRDSIDNRGGNFTFGYAPIGSHGKLFKRTMFETIRYPVGHVHEDLAIAHRLYFPVNRIAILGTCMYAYRKRNDSIIRGIDKDILTKEELFAYSNLLSYSVEISDAKIAKYAGKKIRDLLRRIYNE